MLNTIIAVNCIPSIFSHCKPRQCKVTKKAITDTKKIETNEINKKQSKMNLTHIMCIIC